MPSYARTPLCSLALLTVLTGCGSSSSDGSSNTAGGGNATAGAPTDAAGASSAGSAGAGTGGSIASGGDATAGSSPAGSGGDGSGTSGAGGLPDGSGGMAASGGASAGAPGSAGAAGSPPSANCPSGALFCEDFETFSPMAPPNGKWTSRTNGTATVVVDTTHAHSGTKAVHFHSTTVNNGQRAYILTQGAPAFPVTADAVYVRFMMYIGRYMSVSGTSTHNRIAWLGSAATLASGGNGPGYAFVTYNGIAVERLTNPSQGFQRDASQHMDDASRQNKWQCFEFEIDNKGGVPSGEQSSSTTVPHIWQEGQALKLSAAGSSEPWLPVPFEALQFSLWSPQTDPMPTDYWIDDIAMSTQRIQCPPAP
jgi:hypothetical protein